MQEAVDGFEVLLDGKIIRTPAKTKLCVPTEQLARAIATEWQAQEGEIDPSSMPMTRRANAAIDKVTAQFDEVCNMLCEYGGSDLLCYRAEQPQELAARQAEVWDPLLDWAAAEFNAQLQVTSGVMHLQQDTKTLVRIEEPVRRLAVFPLTAFHDLVVFSGSLIIALAAVRNYVGIDEIWQASRVDEQWQEDLWGKDDEATEASERKEQDFKDAFRFFQISNP